MSASNPREPVARRSIRWLRRLMEGPAERRSRSQTLRVTLDLTPGQVIAIHSLWGLVHDRAATDRRVRLRAGEAARGVLTPEQRRKLDALADGSPSDPVVAEAMRYGLLE